MIAEVYLFLNCPYLNFRRSIYAILLILSGKLSFSITPPE